MRGNSRQLLVGTILGVIGFFGGAIAGAPQCQIGPGREGGCTLYEQTADSGRSSSDGCEDGRISCWDCERDCGGGTEMYCTCTATACTCDLGGGVHITYYI
jgi:hypothetical protein